MSIIFRALSIGSLLLTAAGAGSTAPPNPATGLTARSASITQIDLAWTDNSSNETGFELQRRTYSGNWATISTLPVNAASYADSGLAPFATYIYRVRPLNDSGPAAYWSNEAWADTALPPAPPTNLQGTAVPQAGIELTWTDNSSNERAFEVYQKVTGATDPFWRRAALAPNITRYLIPTSASNIPTTFRVRATNNEGVSAWSNEWSWSPPGVPPASTGLTARVVSNREIELRWNGAGLTAGVVQLARSIVGRWDGVETLPFSITICVDFQCRPGITYYYRMNAYVNGVYSQMSNEVEVTIPRAP